MGFNSNDSMRLISDVPFREGQIATNYPNASLSSLNNTGALLNWAIACVPDSLTLNSFKAPTATGQKFSGIVLLAEEYEQDLSDTTRGIPDKCFFKRLTKGTVAVKLDDDVSSLQAGDPVYFRHTANGTGKLVLGAFRNSAEAGFADLIPSTQAEWRRLDPNGPIYLTISLV